MTTSKPDKPLGHDPLEWLDDVDDGKDEAVNDPVETSMQQQEREEVSADESDLAEQKEAPAMDSVAQTDEQPAGPTEMMFQPDKGKLLIPLPEQLVVQVVDDVFGSWKTLGTLDDLEQLTFDGTGVLSVDGAGIQLLFNAVHRLSMKGVQIRLQRPSDRLNSAIEFSGLKQFFQPFVSYS